ncbi:MAG: hypothetical protein J5J06_12170 [Phycisphaerae bacterium]|nr:hypothetical protein [Phycisphaerae bacterium]
MRTDPSARRYLETGCLAAAAALCAIVLGCQTGDTGNAASTPALTLTDRLVRTYPELESGRFAVIADFEDPVHMELVQVVSVSPSGRCTLDPNGGRPQTGGSALAFTSGSPNDVMVLSNAHADRWYLKRDWRAYDLLLMSIQAPRPGLTADLAIGTGASLNRRYSETAVPLDAGWNVLRLDLAELGENLPLDDIQEIRLSLRDSGPSPVVLHIDDILLVSSRETLWGDPDGPEDQLYAQRVGRRFRIGANGRFDLGFSGGLIVEAYNLASDPSRLLNLVRRGSLSPVPIRLNASGLPVPGSNARDRAFVEATQRIVEANRLRIVVDSEWRIPAPGDSSALPARWRTVIYRSGRVFVTTELSPQATGRAGLIWTLAESAAARTRLSTSSPSAGEALPLLALMNGDATSAGLLRVYNPGDIRLIEQRDPLEKTVSILALPEPGESRPTPRVWYTLWSAPGAPPLDWTDARDQARSFQNPPKPVLQAGAWAPSQPRDESVAGASDAGFNRIMGQYEVTPMAGTARFLLKSGDRPLPNPVFAIPLQPQQRVWVYVDYLIHQPVERGDGYALFEVETKPQSDTLVEVLTDDGRTSGNGNPARN